MRSLAIKKLGKQEREFKVLMGLVEQFIETGKPVGSKTLKDAGFGDLSSATIRNYFANLENEGFLAQLHASGGRIPTNRAFREYAEENREFDGISSEFKDKFKEIRTSESREITGFLQKSAESLSRFTQYAVFLSAPRFDHDYIIDLKLVPIDHSRFLAVIITDFGVIQTEVLHSEQKLSTFSQKRMESYFHYRLTGNDKPENLTGEEEKLAQKLYNELMLRYIVGYSNFTDEDIYRTGFSKLLAYPDFHDTKILASSLSLFENVHSMRLILKECAKRDQLMFWIGGDLMPYAIDKPNCAVLAVPYKIGQRPVGAVGLLGPSRMPYKKLFGILRHFSDSVSEALTRNIYKFKIQYRNPEKGTPYIQKEEHKLIGESRLMLLENKIKEDN